MKDRFNDPTFQFHRVVHASDRLRPPPLIVDAPAIDDTRDGPPGDERQCPVIVVGDVDGADGNYTLEGITILLTVKPFQVLL